MGGESLITYPQAPRRTPRSRRIRFTVTVLDKPGSLVKLLSIISAAGANIIAVEHDRLKAGLDPNETTVHIACEVGGETHGKQLLLAVERQGFRLIKD